MVIGPRLVSVGPETDDGSRLTGSSAKLLFAESFRNIKYLS